MIRKTHIRDTLVIIALLCFGTSLKAQSFDFNSTCKEGYKEVLSMRLESGRQLMAQEAIEYSENLIPILIYSYADFLEVYTSESEALLNEMIIQKTDRLAALEEGEEDPYKRFCQAEVNMHVALARIKFEQYLKAVREIRRAFKLLEENERLYPDFQPNKKSLGFIHALVGTIPDNYKWAASLLGLYGSVPEGMAELESYLDFSVENEYLLYEESIMIYTFFLIYLNNQAEFAWEIAQSIPTDYSLLNTFVVSDIAKRCGHNDIAIQVLENRPQDEVYTPFYFLDYMQGLTKLNRLDEDAGVYIERFLDQFNGHNYVKEAYQRLAWSKLLKGDVGAYHQCMDACLSEGRLFLDADKVAQKAAESGELPNVDLLKARLLYDGGYYERAYAVLKDKTLNDFNYADEQLEFLYRMGRIGEGLGNNELAISYFEQTIEKGEQDTSYFAAKSALQLAYIYEKMPNLDMAISYYKKCMNMNNTEFKNSIDQQAKAALSRINN